MHARKDFVGCAACDGELVVLMEIGSIMPSDDRIFTGAQFIIHKGDWKEKLSQAIAQMSRQVDTPHQLSLF